MALSLLCVRGVIMADEKWIWFEIENEDEVMVLLDVYHEVLQKRTRDLLNELAEDGVTFLAANVPNYSSYTLRHVDRSSVEWRAADGEYEAVVGIKAGTSLHPVYVNRGTGIYGPSGRPYQAFNVTGRMWFYSHVYGRVIGVEEVKGQRAQQFLYTTFNELRIFAQARMLSGAF